MSIECSPSNEDSLIVFYASCLFTNPNKPQTSTNKLKTSSKCFLVWFLKQKKISFKSIPFKENPLIVLHIIIVKISSSIIFHKSIYCFLKETGQIFCVISCLICFPSICSKRTSFSLDLQCDSWNLLDSFAVLASVYVVEVRSQSLVS